MKLSTAMRIGSMTTKQIETHLTDYGNGRCAIGAAMEGANVKVTRFNYNDAQAAFPILDRVVRHPKMSYKRPLLEVIYRLNDRCKVSREEIADYVETIENEEELEKQTSGKVLQEVK